MKKNLTTITRHPSVSCYVEEGTRSGKLREYFVSELLRGGYSARAQHYMRTRKYCYFEFLKTDGKTYRKAMGTINPHFTPPTKGVRTTPPTQQVFFDMEKKEWRSFRKSNLIRILM